MAITNSLYKRLFDFIVQFDETQTYQFYAMTDQQRILILCKGLDIEYQYKDLSYLNFSVHRFTFTQVTFDQLKCALTELEGKKAISLLRKLNPLNEISLSTMDLDSADSLFDTIVKSERNLVKSERNLVAICIKGFLLSIFAIGALSLFSMLVIPLLREKTDLVDKLCLSAKNFMPDFIPRIGLPKTPEIS